jgi:glycosyltransferase involved in cell wall biosynthesis
MFRSDVDDDARKVRRSMRSSPDKDTQHPPTEIPPDLRIAAILPALNEAEAIEEVVGRLVRQQAVPLHAVIVVDNGSTDGTGDLARASGATVVREPRRGYGSACRAGVLAADDNDILVLMDADAADDPADLAHILAPIVRNEADLVVGSRTLGQVEAGAMTARQIAGNRLVCRLIERVSGQHVTDLGPFRAIRRRDLQRLDMRSTTYGWSTEMVVKALRTGYVYREVPVRYHRRIGRSKVGGSWWGSLRAGAVILLTVLRYARWSPKTPPGATRVEVRG